MIRAEAINTCCGPVPADPVDLHFSRRGHGLEFEMEARWIERHLPNEATRIVEIGCGNGRLLNRLGPARTIGLDICADGLVRTRSAIPHATLIAASADSLPLADDSADAVVAQHLIEHLHQYEAALREWSRVLRPGGTLVVVTPNRAFRDPSVFSDPTHVHLFDARDLGAAVASAGFVITQLLSLGLPWFRSPKLAGLWRLRRWIVDRAEWLARSGVLRSGGQSLCCAAQKTD